MRAGRLRHKVQLQVFQQTKGAIGGTKKEWVPLGGPVHAEVKDLRGEIKEVTTEGGKVAKISTEITIRYRPGVVEQMRVLHGDRIYTIQFVNDWERRREKLILSCVSGVINA